MAPFDVNPGWWYDVKCWSRQPISSVFDHWAVAKHIPNGERSSQQTTTISSIHFDGSQNSRSNFKQLPSKWLTSWWITLHSWTILPLRKAGFPVLANQQLFGTLPDHFLGWSPPTSHFFFHYTLYTNHHQQFMKWPSPPGPTPGSCSSSPRLRLTKKNGDITIDLTWIHGWYWDLLGCDFIGTQQYDNMTIWVWKRVPYHEDIAIFMVGQQ